MTTLTLQDMQTWLAQLALAFEREMAALSQLDAALGDGDHGTSMVRAFRSVTARLASSPPPADIGALLQTTGMAVISGAGGATGPLFGTIFLEAGKQAKGKTTLTVADLAAMFEAAAGAVALRGGTKPGEKTMLDALLPAANALQAAAGGADVAAALAQAAQAAEDGAAATAAMLAAKGRARYLGERSLGHRDAGATSVALIVRTLADVATRPPAA